MVKKTVEPVETEEKGAMIQIKRENYETSRTASGGKSLCNGDEIAKACEGLTHDEMYEIADDFLVFPEGKEVDLRDKYKDLNGGMQRMNLGNRFRKRVADIDKANDALIADGKKPGKSGIDKFETVVKPHAKARDVRIKTAAAEKSKAAA
jgi:hypothetical protein